jgi:glycosyltransferase involved in cell wall biosynthesis
MKQLKYSIITGEHSPENIPFLIELYDSLLAQTYTNWEWIILTNNKCLPAHIPETIRSNDKVKVVDTRVPIKNIGMAKKMVCLEATGDVLVEVDHDDLLTPECLAELNIAYQDDEVGFVYSNNAMLDMNHDFIPYIKENGWTYNKYNFRDRELYSMNSFKPTSQSFCYIWFAPDHVRSWRTTAYFEAGGYDENAFVCEDHDLCIRTYLITKTVHIPKVLYIYRVTGVNTSMTERNAEIQVRTKELFNQYARKLAERDAEMKGLLKVDIGGGLNPFPEYLSIDLRDTADVKADLNDGIPLPDNSVGVLNASHIIEHLYDKTKIMSEIHRVLAHGGWAFIEVPSTDGRGAFQDPTHVSYWNENCFLYYTDAYMANFIDNTTIRFQEYRRETYFPNEWMKNMKSCVTSAWLVAIKDDGERFPGLLKI